jgi:putative 2OG-Fe(II) oxygenase
MQTAETLIDTLRRDGFVVVRDFFPPEIVERAHQELLAWYEKDVEDRKAKGAVKPKFEGVAGASVLTEPSHLLLDVYTKSPAFDGMFEKILTDPLSRTVLRKLAGERFKMRGYNIRKMSGSYDPPPAHEWHRDSPGEFCIGIFLTDVEPEEHAATALVPGSHKFPYDPRWNCLFSEPYEGIKFFLRHNYWSRKLGQTALKNASGAYGKQGDFYIFMNDVWHGRQPNLHGSKNMVALLGAFPTDFPYPDTVKMPPPEVLEKVSPVIREVIRQDQPPNMEKDTLLHEMLQARRPPDFADPYWKARLERQVADAVSRPYNFVYRNAPRGTVKSFVVHTSKLSMHYARMYTRLAVRGVYRKTIKRFV